ncbi:MAG: metallophosphoesterase [Acidobacteria bacterium]|nr:metallophosphoesterase [Acidobacteriota bacterium]
MRIFKSRKRAVLTIFGMLLFIALFLVLWAFVIEPNQVTINQTEIKLPAWPAPFAHLKIAAISDLHGGMRYINEAKLEKVVEMTNATEPDLIVLLGDFIARNRDEGLLMTPETIAGKLKGLRAKYGVYAVLGNHDWTFNGERVTRALEGAGIHVLENDVAQIQKDGQTLWLLGVPDFWMRQPIDIRPALAKINAPGPIIALTHNPDVFPTLPPNVILTLAGHTHGGQVNIPFYGRPIVPSQYGERYAAGYIQENNRHLFVTTGIGTTGLAVRFRVPPEIAVLTIN